VILICILCRREIGRFCLTDKDDLAGAVEFDRATFVGVITSQESAVEDRTLFARHLRDEDLAESGQCIVHRIVGNGKVRRVGPACHPDIAVGIEIDVGRIVVAVTDDLLRPEGGAIGRQLDDQDVETLVILVPFADPSSIE